MCDDPDTRVRGAQSYHHLQTQGFQQSIIRSVSAKFDGERSNVHYEESSGRLPVTKLTDLKVRIKILEEMHFTILIDCILIVIEIYEKCSSLLPFFTGTLKSTTLLST